MEQVWSRLAPTYLLKGNSINHVFVSVMYTKPYKHSTNGIRKFPISLNSYIKEKSSYIIKLKNTCTTFATKLHFKVSTSTVKYNLDT